MRVTVRHGPAFAAARCVLDPGEAMRAESGAMMAHSAGVEITAEVEGGPIPGLKRGVPAGESLLQTTFTAPATGGWVDVATALPGDIANITLTPDVPAFVLTRTSWLANSAGVRIDTKWGGPHNLVGGEGGFLVHASGSGEVILGCYGALDVLDLEAGEQVVIDTGYVVAYAPTITFATRRAARGRAIASVTPGEGSVFDFTGPGRVLIQTRNPSAFADFVTGLSGVRD
jgi:uncharacterized protein (TIGR00266 family)